MVRPRRPLLGWFAQHPVAGMLAIGAVTIAVVSANRLCAAGFNRAPPAPAAARGFQRGAKHPASKHAAGVGRTVA